MAFHFRSTPVNFHTGGRGPSCQEEPDNQNKKPTPSKSMLAITASGPHVFPTLEAGTSGRVIHEVAPDRAKRTCRNASA
jgi:hypothetical protein